MFHPVRVDPRSEARRLRVTLDSRKSISRGALWVSLGMYVVILLATGMAGPYWALWAWSFLMIPQYWEGAQRTTAADGSRRLSSSATALLCVWLAVVVVLPALGLILRDVWQVPMVIATPLAILAIGLPVVVTIALLRWDSRRRSEGAGQAA
jgi:hypothetical protein